MREAQEEPESSLEGTRTSICNIDPRKGHGSILKGTEGFGSRIQLFVCLLSFGAFFSLRQRSRGVFSGPVFAARLWFLPLGLRSEMVAPMYIAKFAFVCLLFCCEGYGDWVSRGRDT
jgi:hypothetical protein